MPVLNWIGKDKVINHDKELPFRVLKPVKELSVGEDSENLLIEGDNLEALKALMPFYYGKIKCIYIDPPYNTGNEKWVYNDKVSSPQIKTWLNKVVGSEGEDLCRHDKWLCMMYPRLKLLKDLLSEDGVIFISIDDNEHCNLREIMDEIFGEQNFVTTIIWEKKYAPQNDARWLSENHEYVVLYAKNKMIWRPNLLVRTDEANARYSNPDNDPRGVWKSTDFSRKALEQKTIYEITLPSGRKVYPPKGRSWLTNKTEYERLISDNRIWFGKSGDAVPSLKRYLNEVKQGMTSLTIWKRDEVGDTQLARQDIRQIFGDTSVFDTPKTTGLIKKVLRLATNPNDLILDSFTGSGTTGQSVLELNKEDGGNRRFILIELEKNIARDVTTKRLKKVVEGYSGALYPDGTGQGFQYLDLNGELYNYSGYVNPDAKYEDMAAYIYFTETKHYLNISLIKEPLIGSMGSTNYFLFFEGKGNNILDEKTLKTLDEFKGTKVIYADKCLLDDEFLAKQSVIFKQIPYELKKY